MEYDLFIEVCLRDIEEDEEDDAEEEKEEADSE